MRVMMAENDMGTLTLQRKMIHRIQIMMTEYWFLKYIRLKFTDSVHIQDTNPRYQYIESEPFIVLCVSLIILGNHHQILMWSSPISDALKAFLSYITRNSYDINPLQFHVYSLAWYILVTRNNFNMDWNKQELFNSLL